MHLVLRSTRARGEWSFRRAENDRKVRALVARFSRRYGVRVLSLANVGNHLHFHVQLTHRPLYRPFIRALTGAIAMAVTGASRWKPHGGRFWDARPFTRIVQGLRARLRLRDYIEINQLEGMGATRMEARWLLATELARRKPRARLA
jgi:REP element-mobilizing transposase RayT